MTYKDFTLSQTDYAHAAIAERSRTDWRDEPVMALAPSTKRNKATLAGYAARNKSAFALDRNDAVMRTLEAR